MLALLLWFYKLHIRAFYLVEAQWLSYFEYLCTHIIQIFNCFFFYFFFWSIICFIHFCLASWFEFWHLNSLEFQPMTWILSWSAVLCWTTDPFLVLVFLSWAADSILWFCGHKSDSRMASKSRKTCLSSERTHTSHLRLSSGLISSSIGSKPFPPYPTKDISKSRICYRFSKE